MPRPTALSPGAKGGLATRRRRGGSICVRSVSLSRTQLDPPLQYTKRPENPTGSGAPRRSLKDFQRSPCLRKILSIA